MRVRQPGKGKQPGWIAVCDGVVDMVATAVSGMLRGLGIGNASTGEKIHGWSGDGDATVAFLMRETHLDHVPCGRTSGYLLTDDGDRGMTAEEWPSGQHPGYADALSRFLEIFPEGFNSVDFFDTELGYKSKAKQMLDENVPLDKAMIGRGYGEAVLKVFRATNLLSYQYETTPVAEMLGSRDADTVIQAAARFANDGSEISFREFKRVLMHHDKCARWTVATYLPFLWNPKEHMYLKPRVTKRFAKMVGHPLSSVYQAQLEFDVYVSLLDLVAMTSNELSDLSPPPRDNIDIQSFIWCCCAQKHDSVQS